MDLEQALTLVANRMVAIFALHELDTGNLWEELPDFSEADIELVRQRMTDICLALGSTADLHFEAELFFAERADADGEE
jgi:hypothetical protein